MPTAPPTFRFPVSGRLYLLPVPALRMRVADEVGQPSETAAYRVFAFGGAHGGVLDRVLLLPVGVACR